jgi:hypothetical protein
MQVFAFDEASEDAFSDSAFEFRFLVLHYASLMHACALIDMRQDEHLTTGLTLQREDPYMFCPNRVEASSNKVTRRPGQVVLEVSLVVWHDEHAQAGWTIDEGPHRAAPDGPALARSDAQIQPRACQLVCSHRCDGEGRPSRVGSLKR